MCPLQRVLDKEAGPEAVGLLLPPGRRTFLILRPRSLNWDLLLKEEDASGYRLMPREDATIVAQKVYRALELWAAGGPGQVEAAPPPSEGSRYIVRCRVGPYQFIVCPRRPGQAYQPEVFDDHESAQRAAAALAAVLRPPPERVQEVYFNTRNFSP